MSRTSKCFAAALIAAIGLVTHAAAQTPPAPPGGVETTARDQRVREAVDATAAVKGKKGEEREVALERAATLWEGVLRDFGDADRATGARAAWEAGELWRRRGDLEPADTCYARCLALDEGRFRERATIARANVARRQERLDDAITLYREVESMRPDSARAHEARLRIGRCLEAKGESAAAVESYRAALDAVADNPRRAVDAGNHLARALVTQGDLEGAAAAIGRVESIARPVLDAGGEDAERLRKALDGMSARRALQRARDDRDGAGEDAERLDEDDRLRR